MLFILGLVSGALIVEFCIALAFFVYGHDKFSHDEQGVIFIIMVLHVLVFLFQTGFMIHFMLNVYPVLQALELGR